MSKEKKFEDPLEELDPIMSEAFSQEEAPEEQPINELPSEPLEDTAPAPIKDSEDVHPFQEEETITEDEIQPPETETTETVAEQAFPDIDTDPTDENKMVADIEFPDLTMADSGNPIEKDVFSHIPVTVNVELGRSKISLKEIFELTEGSIIELERMVGEPLDLVVNGQVVAQGEVVAIDNNYGFRVTNIVAKAQT